MSVTLLSLTHDCELLLLVKYLLVQLRKPIHVVKLLQLLEHVRDVLQTCRLLLDVLQQLRHRERESKCVCVRECSNEF